MSLSLTAEMSSMTTTTEEDTELRDLVAATLETSGVLGKIKAQLRANVYIALEEGNLSGMLGVGVNCCVTVAR